MRVITSLHLPMYIVCLHLSHISHTHLTHISQGLPSVPASNPPFSLSVPLVVGPCSTASSSANANETQIGAPKLSLLCIFATYPLSRWYWPRISDVYLSPLSHSLCALRLGGRYPSIYPVISPNSQTISLSNSGSRLSGLFFLILHFFGGGLGLS